MALIQLHHNATVGTNVRNEQLDGKEWLVAPCVAIVAGVLNGLLVPADEIMISTMSWNGRSIPVHHPNTNTANEPMTVQNQVIGYFYAANFETDRLKGEMWLDVAKAQNLGGDAAAVIEAVQNGGMVEVSTAYWAYTISQAGEFNGVPYTGITTHILPDHIAVLPGDEGACNIDDGCGLNRNQRSESMKYKMLHNGEMVELELRDFENGRKPTCHRTDNVEGMSHRDVGKALRSAVDMVTQVATDHWIWIEDVYDDYFVYEIEAENSDSEGLWRRDYSVAADFTVTLGEASRVVRRTVYEAAPAQPAPAMNEKTFMNQVKTFVTNLFQNHDKERNMKEMIAAIIENGKTGMTAEQLGELPETAVSAMFNGLQLNEDEPEADDGSIAGGEPATPAPAADPEAETMPAWAGELVAKVDSLTKSTNAAVEQKKVGIIKQLVANERVTFSEAELKAFTLPQLEKFAATFIEPDYSGLFFGQNEQSSEYEEVGLAINVKEEAK